jgi:anti-sigma B factor antagonist
VVLVHDEAVAVAGGVRLGGPGLGRGAEVALGAVAVRATTPFGTLRAAMDANPIVLDESADDVVVVVVEGEHDIYTAPTLRERLEEALERGGGVVVDLTGATFVDSSVLGALLDARRRALDADQGYVVCVGDQVEPGVQRILDITGLVPVLPVVGDRAQAIETARDGGVRG